MKDIQIPEHEVSAFVLPMIEGEPGDTFLVTVMNITNANFAGNMKANHKAIPCYHVGYVSEAEDEPPLTFAIENFRQNLDDWLEGGMRLGVYTNCNVIHDPESDTKIDSLCFTEVLFLGTDLGKGSTVDLISHTKYTVV